MSNKRPHAEIKKPAWKICALRHWFKFCCVSIGFQKPKENATIMTIGRY
jgi:hypothetical protein